MVEDCNEQLHLSRVPKFFEAARLLVVTHSSSAFVERVFSHLTLIRRIIGDRATRDIFELWALIRCNRDLVDDYHDNDE